MASERGEKKSVVAIIPAAGPSTRMGVLDKLLLPVSGIPLIKRTVASVLPCVDEVIVVVSSERAAEVMELLESDAVVVVNPRPQDGMGSSIAAGVRRAMDADGYLILPGDMPVVRSETIGRIVEHFIAMPDRIALPVRDGRRGRPEIFPSWARVDLCALTGEVGINPILEANGSRILDVQVGDPGIWQDIDKPDDYHALVSSL